MPGRIMHPPLACPALPVPAERMAAQFGCRDSARKLYRVPLNRSRQQFASPALTGEGQTP